MKAYQARDIVRDNFKIAENSLRAVEQSRGVNVANFNVDGVRGIIRMIELEIIEDLYKLDENEVDEVVKEVVG